MKILCTVSVINRLLPSLAINQKHKNVKSTLALCKHPKSSNHLLILFSTNNKNGTKYELNKNISTILTRFINEGKATIQFKQPEHDLHIQSEDIIQLKSFLHLIKRVLENKMTDKDFRVSSLGVTPIKVNETAPKKLIITKRSDYPVKGFPRTLEYLCIKSINRCSLDRGILQLYKLKILDLSDNLIEYLPDELSQLPNLTDINLSSNCLGRGTPKQWDWINGKLTKSLKQLNVSNNCIKFLPDQLIKLHSLISLFADKNNIKVLPSGIGNLRNLKMLTLANNELESIPGSMSKLRLDTLDLSHNKFGNLNSCRQAAILPKPLPVMSLKEYSARKILNIRLSYTPEILPPTVIKFLETAKYCVCGNPCFKHYIKYPQVLLLTTICNSLTVTSAQSEYVPMDCYFCCVTCFSKSNFIGPRMLIECRPSFVR